DAAALLGALADDERRLRKSGHPDAAQRQGHPAHEARDHGVLDGARGRLARVLSAARAGTVLRWLRADPRRGVLVGRVEGRRRVDAALRARAVQILAAVSSPDVRGDGARPRDPAAAPALSNSIDR